MHHGFIIIPACLSIRRDAREKLSTRLEMLNYVMLLPLSLTLLLSVPGREVTDVSASVA